MEEEKKGYLNIGEKDKGKRLDKYLKEVLSLSRERIKSLIHEGLITVNNEKKKPSYSLLSGDRVYYYIPLPKKMEIKAEEGDIEILYEDKYLAIINKPPGLSVHPSPGIYEHTLVNILLSKFKDLSGIGGVERPGIVHRLDKDTSGIMIIAKEERAHLILSDAFKNRKIAKTYLAITYGAIAEDKGKIDAPIGRDPVHRKKMKVILNNAREAITHFEVLKRFKSFTYIKASPKTGRTHQIRVHLAYIGHPLVGDATYSKKKIDIPIKRHALHAYSIRFEHPILGKTMEFSVEPPKDFQSLLSWLEEEFSLNS